ncbi:MAG: hypothetical protein ACR2J9_10550, partial [Gaiellales bacterium]
MRRRSPRLHRTPRLALLAVVAALFALGIGSSTAAACAPPSTMWTKPTTGGKVVGAVLSGKMNLVVGSVTPICNDPNYVARVEGTITTPNDATQIYVMVQYKNDKNWKLTISATPTGTAYYPANWSSIDLRHLQGTITNNGGTITETLKVSGYVLGSATMDLTVVIDPSAKVWAGSATLAGLQIGGLTINQATIKATSNGTAEVLGNVTTKTATFAADISVIGKTAASASDVNPLKWALDIYINGSQINGATPTMGFSFFIAHGRYTQYTDASTCVTFSFNADAKWALRGNEYEVNNFSFEIDCKKLHQFSFTFIATHYPAFGGSVQATFTMNYYLPNDSQKTYTAPWRQDPIYYYGGFLGSVDLAYIRHFSEKYQVSPGIDDTFSRDVTVGIGLSAGLVAWNPSQTTFTPFVEVGGWLTADRVGGNVYCNWNAPGTDFACYATLHWNPKNAGEYDTSW